MVSKSFRTLANKYWIYCAKSVWQCYTKNKTIEYKITSVDFETKTALFEITWRPRMHFGS